MRPSPLPQQTPAGPTYPAGPHPILPAQPTGPPPYPTLVTRYSGFTDSGGSGGNPSSQCASIVIGKQLILLWGPAVTERVGPMVLAGNLWKVTICHAPCARGWTCLT